MKIMKFIKNNKKWLMFYCIFGGIFILAFLFGLAIIINILTESANQMVNLFEVIKDIFI